MVDMMTLKANPRESVGTRAARKLRKTGRIPAVAYGHGEPPESLDLALHDVMLAMGHGVRMLQVEVSGTAKQYLIKDVQYDHLGSAPIHVDLARVAMDERVKVRVGLKLRGVPKGVAEGGLLDQHLVDVEVECLVTEIPDTLYAVVTELGLGDSLLVKDLPLPAGMEVLTSGEDRVATLRAPVEEVAAEEAKPGEEGVAQPERIGRVRPDEEKGGA